MQKRHRAAAILQTALICRAGLMIMIWGVLANFQDRDRARDDGCHDIRDHGEGHRSAGGLYLINEMRVGAPTLIGHSCQYNLFAKRRKIRHPGEMPLCW